VTINSKVLMVMLTSSFILTLGDENNALQLQRNSRREPIAFANLSSRRKIGSSSSQPIR